MWNKQKTNEEREIVENGEWQKVLASFNHHKGSIAVAINSPVLDEGACG